MNEPLLFLPGHMCDARVFAPQVASLSYRMPIHLGSIAAGRSIFEIACSVLESASSRFALAGLSMGGIVAMEIVRLAPGRVTRLALLDTNHRPETAKAAKERRERIERAKAGGFVEVIRDEMKPAYLAGGPNRETALETVMEMAVALGPEIFVMQSEAIISRPDQTATLPKIDVPTLVLCGEEDRLCPVSRHVEIAGAIPGARLAVIEGAGHLPTLEQPKRTTEALLDWLEVN